MGLFKDLADKSKNALKKAKVRFSSDTATAATIVPPTKEAVEAIAPNQPILPLGTNADKTRSRSASSASASQHSIDSQTLEIVPPAKPGKDVLPQIQFQRLRQSFYAVKQFWGKTSKKNITLLPEHTEVFDSILRHIEAGEVNDNQALKNITDEKIVEHFLYQWSTARLARSAAIQGGLTPTPSTWNPLTLAARSVHAAANSVSSAFGSPSSTPVPTAQILTEDFTQYMLDVFKPLLADIKKDAKTNILLKLSRWPAGLLVSPPELGMAVNNHRLSDTVLIQPCALQLARIYTKAVENYDEEAFKQSPSEFFTDACLALHTYYYELKKVNTFLQANRRNAYLWRAETIQQALSYYFEQGRVLYEIHAMVQNVPDHVRADKITLMQRYEKYIKDLYAREETYTRTAGPFAFGYDKWTKIEAAMEQYRFLRGLPHDIYPKPNPERLKLMHYAGEQGRLRDLKAQGLYLGYGQGLQDEDPFNPLNLPTRLQAMKI